MAELLLTDPAALRIRATTDVDIIVAVATRSAYNTLEMELRALGIAPDQREGAPVCRTRTPDGLILDTMPLDPKIIGFSNSWYPYAIESATRETLEPGLTIRAVSAPAFLATKWEAYSARGGDDPLMSRDLEDIVMVISGRDTIVEDVATCRGDVRSYLSSNAREFTQYGWAEEIIENAVQDAIRIPELRSEALARFQAIANL